MKRFTYLLLTVAACGGDPFESAESVDAAPEHDARVSIPLPPNTDAGLDAAVTALHDAAAGAWRADAWVAPPVDAWAAPVDAYVADTWNGCTPLPVNTGSQVCEALACANYQTVCEEYGNGTSACVAMAPECNCVETWTCACAKAHGLFSGSTCYDYTSTLTVLAPGQIRVLQ